MTFVLDRPADLKPALPSAALKPICLQCSGNIFDAGWTVFHLAQSDLLLSKAKPLSGAEAVKTLQNLVIWDEKKNLYDGRLLYVSRPGHVAEEQGIEALPDWQRLWNIANAEALEGPPRFQGGNLVAQAELKPQSMTADEFRLKEDSPGYQATADGQHVGVNVDLLGPGPAYERWKRNPRYERWHEDTSLRKTARTTSAESFLLLESTGGKQRTFGTLAEAVAFVHDGDVIEVKGNGPFDTEPIRLSGVSLTLRAGKGFRPVIRLVDGDCLLTTNAKLTLEGLELQSVASGPWSEGICLIACLADLHAANCRFVFLPGRGGACVNVWGNCHVRNCAFINTETGATGAVGWCVPSRGKLVMHNCIHTGTDALWLTWRRKHVDDLSIALSNNTVAGTASATCRFLVLPEAPQHDSGAKPVRVEFSDNIFADHGPVLCVRQYKDSPWPGDALAPDTTEKLLAALFSWHGHANVLSTRERLLNVRRGSQSFALSMSFSSLADWKQFWHDKQDNSSIGAVRFVGDDVRLRIRTDPAGVVPQDFRLHPGSAGHGSGPGGRDIGAEVSLVGPGEAYERWKETQDYRQWLAETAR